MGANFNSSLQLDHDSQLKTIQKQFNAELDILHKMLVEARALDDKKKSENSKLLYNKVSKVDHEAINLNANFHQFYQRVKPDSNNITITQADFEEIHFYQRTVASIRDYRTNQLRLFFSKADNPDSAQDTKKDFNDLFQHLKSETDKMDKLHSKAKRLDKRNKTRESEQFLKKVASHKNNLTKTYITFENYINSDINYDQISLIDYENYHKFRRYYKRCKHHREIVLQNGYNKNRRPEFFERLLTTHLLGPLMVAFFVSTAMMGYSSIAEVTPGSWLVLLLAVSQSLYYFGYEKDENVKQLAAIGTTIDDIVFHFSFDNFNHYQLFMILGAITSVTVGLAFAAAIITYLPPLALIATWPTIYQFAILTGVGMFLSSAALKVCQQIYYLVTNENKNNHGGRFVTNFIFGVGVGIFFAFVAIAQAAEQLAMLAMLINIGATAQLFIAMYGLWYFISRQISGNSQLEYLNNKVNELTWKKLHGMRWEILKMLLIFATIIAFTGLFFYPPALIAPTVVPLVTKLGLITLSEAQRFLVTLGLVSFITLLVPPILSEIYYQLFGPTDELDADPDPRAGFANEQQQAPPTIFQVLVFKHDLQQSLEFQPSDADKEVNETPQDGDKYNYLYNSQSEYSFS